MISITGFAASLFAFGYVREYEERCSIGAMGGLFNAFLFAMIGVVTADNALLFLILWEIMSVVSYFLVVSEHEKKEVQKAGIFYLVMTHLGTAFIILSFILFYQQTGNLDFESFRRAAGAFPLGIRTLIFLSALIGFGTKAGIVPLHVWLPSAHPAAPSHVSALMSGVMIKTAIYGLIRTYFDFLGGTFPPWWGFLVLVIGSVSALLGVMYALMEHDLKSLLAYHSVENIGIILLGVGCGMIFRSYGLNTLAAVGLLAGLYHTVNHAAFKSLLFMGAGSVQFITHSRNMEECGGLIHKMPWTAVFFLVGSVSISALPPSNGFVSEWLIFQSLFLSFHIPSLSMKIFLPIGAALLALTGVLALVCFAKAFGISFLAMPRSRMAKLATEVPLTMRAGMALLTLSCLGLGLGTAWVIPSLDRVIFSLNKISVASEIVTRKGWSIEPAGLQSTSVSTPVLGFLILIFSLLVFLIIRLGASQKKSRFYRTWACGLKLQPINEYTSTGFVQPIRQIFSMIYKPTVKLESEMLEKSQHFAKEMRFELTFQPIFEKYLYDPVVRTVLSIANRFHVIQAGSIHVYLSYMFVTLILLLLWTTL